MISFASLPVYFLILHLGVLLPFVPLHFEQGQERDTRKAYANARQLHCGGTRACTCCEPRTWVRTILYLPSDNKQYKSDDANTMAYI